MVGAGPCGSSVLAALRPLCSVLCNVTICNAVVVVVLAVVVVVVVVLLLLLLVLLMLVLLLLLAARASAAARGGVISLPACAETRALALC